MLSPHFSPVEIDGYKFDNGMILYEFDALREPERTKFRKIGEWMPIPMNQIPTPQMYWMGKFWPDLYIANQLNAAVGDHANFKPLTDKARWPDELDLHLVSVYHHGVEFHETFIEPMCRKIAGRSTSQISAKYHRAIWLPIYWQETLRARQSIPTPLYYPKAGYAGAIGEKIQFATNAGTLPKSNMEKNDLSIAFLLAKPRTLFSVLFVVDPSPIYRITDMDVCAGIETQWHRWVVEWTGPRKVLSHDDLAPFASESKCLGVKQLSLPIPTIENVRNGWKPRPHLNDQLLEVMNEL